MLKPIFSDGLHSTSAVLSCTEQSTSAAKCARERATQCTTVKESTRLHLPAAGCDKYTYGQEKQGIKLGTKVKGQKNKNIKIFCSALCHLCAEPSGERSANCVLSERPLNEDLTVWLVTS